MQLFQFIGQVRFHLKGCIKLILEFGCGSSSDFLVLLLSCNNLISFWLFFNFFLLYNRIFFLLFFRLSLLFRFIFWCSGIGCRSFLDLYGSGILCLFERFFLGGRSCLGGFCFSGLSRILLLSCGTFCLFLKTIFLAFFGLLCSFLLFLCLNFGFFLSGLLSFCLLLGLLFSQLCILLLSLFSVNGSLSVFLLFALFLQLRHLFGFEDSLFQLAVLFLLQALFLEQLLASMLAHLLKGKFASQTSQHWLSCSLWGLFSGSCHSSAFSLIG